nr:DNA polymerase III subunit alpha [Actinomycetota bacterium]
RLGLLKMDFLGLRNLSVIEDCVGLLRAKDIACDIDHVALDDEATYRMLRAADTDGVFQLEGGGMRQLIQMLQPDRFEDLMALVALYRPGLLSMGQHTEYAERKHGRKPVVYPHASLEDILKDTYGIIVYQEQVMQIAVRVGGYSMGQADLLRKAMGKKIRELLVPHRETFVKGAVERGYQERLAQDIFDLIVPFADYGFNASHACAYAYVAYQTAYLKAHYPVEYFSALLTSVKDDKDKKPFYLNAARLRAIRVLPPDVNQSQMHFTPSDGEVRYGLAAVRNVGAGVVHSIVAARTEKGQFESLTDFCRKVDAGVLHKKCMESLILAGAFDSLGYARRALLENYEKIATPVLADRRAEAVGQFSFFGGEDGPSIDIDESVLRGEEFARPELLRLEKEMLGQYVTDHPLLSIKGRLDALVDLPISEVPGLGDGDVVTVAGIVGSLGRRFTKRGEPYAVFRLEDLTGGVGVVVFPSLFDKSGPLIATDRIVLVKGRADLRGRELQLVALEVSEPDLTPSGPGYSENGGPTGPGAVSDPLVVDVPTSSCTDGLITRLKVLFRMYPGDLPVIVRLVNDGEAMSLRLGEGYRVDGCPALMSELTTLLGSNAVRIPAGLPVASTSSAPA